MRQQLILNNIGEAISNTDIHSAENQMGITFPKPYIDFLLSHNGGDMSRNLPNRKIFIRDFLHLNESDDSIQGIFSVVSEIFGGIKDWLPFGFDFGDWIFCICLKKEKYGQIYLMRTDEIEEDEAFEFIANSFEEFIDSLQPESEVEI